MTESNPIVSIDQSNADEAYQRVLPEAMALSSDSLVTINLDVPTCVITAMGVIEKLAEFRDRIRALPHTPVEHLDSFADYVLGLFTAQSRYTFAVTPPEPLPELLEEASAKRDVLIADARALAARGLLNGELLKELTGTHGYKNVAFDLSGLSQMFKVAWATVEGKTGLQRSELEETDKLALRLAAAIAHREGAKESVAAATDARQRIYTLFFNTYDQIRRAIAYLRWDEGDVDDIAPSLFAGRPNSNLKAKPQAPSAKTEAQTPGAPAAQEPGSASSASNAKIPVGLPGSDPLMTA